MRRLLVAIGVASMMTFAVPSVTLAQRTGTLSAQLTIDSARAAETLDLSRYSLGQGGLSSQTMINIPAVADLHPRSIRFFIQEYYNLYPGHGVYHWDTLDRFLTAVVATGARPIANIAFKPKVLYPKIDQGIVHPTSYREWEELVYRLVKHCREKGYGIQYWEISNEGDIGEAGGSPYLFTPDDYIIYITHIQRMLCAGPIPRRRWAALHSPATTRQSGTHSSSIAGTAMLHSISFPGTVTRMMSASSVRPSAPCERGALDAHETIERAQNQKENCPQDVLFTPLTVMTSIPRYGIGQTSLGTPIWVRRLCYEKVSTIRSRICCYVVCCFGGRAAD